MQIPVYAIFLPPTKFVSRSGLEPLAEVLGAHKICCRNYWERMAVLNWRLGHWGRIWGQYYFGSEWNALIPLWDEWRIAQRIKDRKPSIAHCLFAEFAGLRWVGPVRSRGARVVGTFHVSPRRQARVMGGMRLDRYDCISVVSKTMMPYILEKGYPSERLFLTLHGVDTDYFCPARERTQSCRENGPLRGLLVGATERDHEFAAAVMKQIPPGVMDLYVATLPQLHYFYHGIAGVHLLEHQSDAGMLHAYQHADLLFMPMLDATANNAILEAMACGTPIMANSVGGVPEYANPSCNILMENKNVDDWVDTLKEIIGNREKHLMLRKAVRSHAETLSWKAVVPQYYAMYRAAVQ